jgi:hypothetical protein
MVHTVSCENRTSKFRPGGGQCGGCLGKQKSFFLLARIKVAIIRYDYRTVGAMEAEIKEALVGILNGIKRSDFQTVSDGMVRIETSLESGRKKLHPQLVHFLERRSYAKALDFLGGSEGIPQGTDSSGVIDP